MSPLLLRGLLIVIPVVLYLQVISPLYYGGGQLFTPESSITQLQTLSSQYDTTLKQAQSLLNQADSLENAYKTFPEDAKSKLEVMVPNKIDPIRLVNEVNAIIEDAEFTTNDISYQQSDNLDSKGQKGYQISFTTKGTYPRFKHLIDNFEKSLRAYEIKSISFDVPDSEKDLTTFQVRLETYSMK